MIHIDNVSFRYEKATKPVLSNISLNVSCDNYTLVIGPSNAGKSTLCKLVKGLLGSKQGEIVVPRELNQVGYIPSDPDEFFVGSTVEEDIAFGLENLENSASEIMFRVEQSLRTLRIEHLRYRSIQTLSGGEKQLAALAGLLALQCRYFVLDDCLAMLDIPTRKRISNQLARLRKDFRVGMLHATSHLGEIRSCDRAVFLDKGMILYDGSPISFLRSSIGKDYLEKDQTSLSLSLLLEDLKH
jgi:energy-coupling factor transporter ATP-binding protein EcfA2